MVRHKGRAWLEIPVLTPVPSLPIQASKTATYAKYYPDEDEAKTLTIDEMEEVARRCCNEAAEHKTQSLAALEVAHHCPLHACLWPPAGSGAVAKYGNWPADPGRGSAGSEQGRAW